MEVCECVGVVVTDIPDNESVRVAETDGVLVTDLVPEALNDAVLCGVCDTDVLLVWDLVDDTLGRLDDNE